MEQESKVVLTITHQKALLFIEPCLSFLPLIVKAKEKKYDTLVISSLVDCDLLMEASSSYFLVNAQHENAVLDLVKKITQKFSIEGFFAGTAVSQRLSSKVGAFLDKPIPSVFNRKDLIDKTLQSCCGTIAKEAWGRSDAPLSGVLIEEGAHGKEYTVVGFSKNGKSTLVSIIENFFSSSHIKGYVTFSNLGPLTFIEPYLQSIISVLNYTHGPFCAHIRVTAGGLSLLDISNQLGGKDLSEFLHLAMAIDVYDVLLKGLFTESSSFSRKPSLNAGMIYYSDPRVLKVFQGHSHVHSIRTGGEGADPSRRYIVFFHENEEILKELIQGLSNVR